MHAFYEQQTAMANLKQARDFSATGNGDAALACTKRALILPDAQLFQVYLAHQLQKGHEFIVESVQSMDAATQLLVAQLYAGREDMLDLLQSSMSREALDDFFKLPEYNRQVEQRQEILRPNVDLNGQVIDRAPAGEDFYIWKVNGGSVTYEFGPEHSEVMQLGRGAFTHFAFVAIDTYKHDAYCKALIEKGFVARLQK